MIYELRTYYIKPGKMEDIHNRFSNLTIDLFRKYGMNIEFYINPIFMRKF
ncbi:hypothetical protein SDC9_173615 [bioreactor metagenome]|uniref:NIPSNAP domain-containing protein n=1 Tax=bioreactor metagenome TaxID=1076179 RepID=A0A645GGV3_9ZZZZ